MTTIIIGGGIAGLYSAYQLRKRNKPFLLLEKSTKKDLGGRMGSPLFHGVPVAKGAGIGRKRKDKILQELLQELNIKTHEFKATTQYAGSQNCDVKNIFENLKQYYENQDPKPNHLTFREFAEPLLGKAQYKIFTTCSGYTDYENEDVESTIYDYGFDDNYTNYTGISIPWSEVIQEITKKIGEENIKCNTEVLKITRNTNPPIIHIHTKSRTYTADQVIIATTIQPLRHLLPQIREYKNIESQPFLRIYGKFSKTSIPHLRERIKTTTILPGDFHKLIPINPEKGIYMIVYTDNRGARKLKQYTENTQENRDYLTQQLEKVLEIPKETLQLQSILSFYWTEGTHYYNPLPETPYKSRKQFIRAAQCPYPHVFVVGEMISQNQGWVEGALESVAQILIYL